MLRQILKEFKYADGPLDLKELSRRLGVERSALEGMLQLLVRQGKLHEVDAVAETCAHCAGRLSCAQRQSSAMMAKAYKLVS